MPRDAVVDAAQRQITEFLRPIGRSITDHYTRVIQNQIERQAREWIDTGYASIADYFTLNEPSYVESANGAKRQRVDAPSTSQEIPVELVDLEEAVNTFLETINEEDEDEPEQQEAPQQAAATDSPILRERLMAGRNEPAATEAPAEPAGDVDMAELSVGGGSGGYNTGASGGGQQQDGGRPLFPDGPFVGKNKCTKTFTKVFYLKLYANGMQEFIAEDGVPMRVMGWQTVIPYQALSSYMTAQEYLSIVRNYGYAKIKHAAFQLEFCDIRTPFGVNLTEVAEANGNLQFEIQEFHGLEKMLPFQTVETNYPISTINDVKPLNNFSNWINKLYGSKPFSQDSTVRQKTDWPAEMYQRGLDMRPMWQFSPSNVAAREVGTGSMFRSYNQHITALPFGKHATRRVNTNVAKVGGVYFNRVYSPKNGIITAAPTAFDTKYEQYKPGRFTRINQPIKMDDMNARNPYPYQDPSKPQYTSNWFQDAINAITSFSANTEVVSKVDGVIGQNVKYIDDNTYSNMALRVCSTVNVPNPPLAEARIAGVDVQTTGTCGPSATQNNLDIRREGIETPRIVDLFNFPEANLLTGVNHSDKTVLRDISPVREKATNNVRDVDGYGYSNDIEFYSRATLENYSVWTSRNQPPIHHMPSWLIGIVPKTTGPQDTSDIVHATATFLCKTAITIDCSEDSLLTTNFSYNYDVNQWQDPILAAEGTDVPNYLYNGKWQHNETDVFLREDKAHTLDYARAAKMGFVRFDNTEPTL